MFYKIEKTYLETMSAIIEAENLEEAKKMLKAGKIDLHSDGNYGCIASIIMQPDEDCVDVTEYADADEATDICDWVEVAGYNEIKWERTDYDK